MADRPGIMIYFDILETLHDGYTTKEAGELFLAMLHYGRDGIKPNFSDRGMKTLWKVVQVKIDRDNLKYSKTIELRKYATFCREYKKLHPGEEPPSFDVWRDHVISDDEFDIQLATTTSNYNYNREQGTINKDAVEMLQNNPANVQKPVQNSENEFEQKRQKALAMLEDNI